MGRGKTRPTPASQCPSANFAEFSDYALQQFQSCNGLAAGSRESNANDMVGGVNSYQVYH